MVVAMAAGLAACRQPAPVSDPSTSPSPDAAPDSIRDQVLAVVEQYYADLSARDWPRVYDHFWPGATLTTPWQPPGDSAIRVMPTTIEQFIEQAPLGPGSREIFEERMDSARVRGSAALAQVWSWYSARFGDPGQVEAWTGTDAFTLIRHEGRWRIASLAYVNEGGPR
jgi:hypothetical protein